MDARIFEGAVEYLQLNIPYLVYGCICIQKTCNDLYIPVRPFIKFYETLHKGPCVTNDWLNEYGYIHGLTKDEIKVLRVQLLSEMALNLREQGFHKEMY